MPIAFSEVQQVVEECDGKYFCVDYFYNGDLIAYAGGRNKERMTVVCCDKDEKVIVGWVHAGLTLQQCEGVVRDYIGILGPINEIVEMLGITK
jgi:hypothetical protein